MSITSGFEKNTVTVELYGSSGPVTDYYYDTNDVDQLLAHARALEEMLRKHEFDQGGDGDCPECQGDQGHDPDCALAKLLG